MICLLQFLFWECWKGKRYLDCEGKGCRFYGSDTCYAKDGDHAEGTTSRQIVAKFQKDEGKRERQWLKKLRKDGERHE